MLLRNGKFTSLSNRQLILLPESNLRSGRAFRKEYNPLKWIDMEKVYNDFILSNITNRIFNEKLIPLDISKQLENFQVKIHIVVDKILNANIGDSMDSQMIDIYLGLRFLRENINLFFSPTLVCNKYYLEDVKLFVNWFQEILDWLNNTPMFLKMFTYNHLIQLSQEFEPIYNIWLNLEEESR